MVKNNKSSLKKMIILLFVVLLITSCSSQQKIEQTRELMGTIATITVYNEDKESAEKAIEAAFKEMERIEGLLSNYKNTSEVYLLNENGEIDNASNELIYVLGKSLSYGDLSEGAFDITVQPILDLYKHTFEELKRPPTDEEIKETLKLVGYEKIFIKNRHVEFTEPNMKITLGGIAKGYAVDKAIDVLQDQGIKHALVDMKSSIRAIGNKGTEDWSIALQNPRNKDEYITIIRMDDNSLSTSGDYERYFNENMTFHHIINPKTGYSATELISVTIIADNAMAADALSTSVFVLGKEKGLELIERSNNVEGLIITREKEIIKSSGFLGD